MKPGYVVLIAVVAVALVAIGFYMMKRLDNFLAENHKKITAKDAENPHDRFRIAFENPVIMSSIAEYLEMLSKAYSDCNFYFFIGTAEQIHHAIETDYIDIGFILSTTADDTTVPLRTNEYYAGTLGCSIELLEAGQQYIRTVKANRDTEPKKQEMMNELMKSMECTKD
ncbi:MAG: hypothetical protein ACI4F2_08300 [Acutalibacteraceae bacterium]